MKIFYKVLDKHKKYEKNYFKANSKCISGH